MAQGEWSVKGEDEWRRPGDRLGADKEDAQTTTNLPGAYHKPATSSLIGHGQRSIKALREDSGPQGGLGDGTGRPDVSISWLVGLVYSRVIISLDINGLVS
uniref:Uncharacterized protein n=1 Tax=Steinernema glaseri TaxID=37863 RepID=A0A1I7ZA41_9BILA